MISSLKFLPKDFTTLRTSFIYKFFALNLLFQDTSYSLPLKYSSFLFKFFSFAFYNINFWFKSSKICPKIVHFSQISHSRGNSGYQQQCTEMGIYQDNLYYRLLLIVITQNSLSIIDMAFAICFVVADKLSQ